jgi:hypothetical protein
MSSPELVAPTRLEELLAGAFPETEAEARLQGLARELRSASWSSAPASVRERVVSVKAERPRVRVPRWRLAIVLGAAAVVAGVVATTGFHSPGLNKVAGSAAGGGSRANALERANPPVTQDAAGKAFGSAPIPAGRAQDVDMWIDLRVKDADAISSAAQQAQSITRELGGVVVSSNVATQGKQGHAELALKIPVAKVQDASFRLSQLGTITGQRVSTTDLQAALDRDARRIEHLRGAIRIELARLASGQLTAAEELQARIHLEHLRRNLNDVLRARAALAARAAMADLTLRLDTPTGAAPQKSESGISGAADKAVDFLRGAGAVAVFLTLVLSPLVVLVVLAWLALRARARRIEAQLLDEPRPGAPAEKPTQ